MENILLFFSLKYRGNWDRIYSALEQKELVLKKELDKSKGAIKSNYLTIIDSQFPNHLKQCPNPPFVLYTYGNQDLLLNYDSSIAIIGGSNYEKYGVKVMQQLLEDWCQKHCLIIVGSNMACFELVMSWLADNGGQLIVVLDGDLSSFEQRHKILIEKFKSKNLLIVSEFYQGLDPDFDNQNLYQRLVVGLSRRLVFIEISKKDANFTIFKQALREDKEIFCVPEVIGSKFDGSNFILKHRGKLVEIGDDVFTSPIFH